VIAASTGGDAFLLIEIGSLLVLLGVLARIADKLDLSPIPLYLLTGLLLGYFSDGPITFSENVIGTGAQLGVVLLLFMLGLEFTGGDLYSSLKTGVKPALLDIVLNFTPGFVVALLLGWNATAAVILGGVTYISSSGIVAKLVSDLGRLGNRETPAVLSILVMEDLVMVIYLPLLAALLVGSSLMTGLTLLTISLVIAITALVIAITYGHRLSGMISSRSDEVLLLTVLGIVLVVAGMAEQIKVSAAVGAFLVGIMLSGPLAKRARSLFSPLRDLFAAAFFIFFGLNIDIASVGPIALVALGLGVVTALTKILTGKYAAKRVGAANKGQLRSGTALIARGEFSIVIAGLGVTAGLESELGPLAATYVLFTALAGTLITRFSSQISDLTDRSFKAKKDRPSA